MSERSFTPKPLPYAVVNSSDRVRGICSPAAMYSYPLKASLWALPGLLLSLPPVAWPQDRAAPPYPRSAVLAGITWHWETHRTAAPGSDLWPVTWGADGHLYTAWGDGGGFGGTDQDGRVALGFARIEGSPERFVGINVNGGKDPRHRASFAKHGKSGGVLAVGDRLYAWLNTQN